MWTAPTILIKNTLKKYRSTKSYWKYWPSTFIFNIYFFISVSRVSSLRFHKQTWRIFCKILVSYNSQKLLQIAKNLIRILEKYLIKDFVCNEVAGFQSSLLLKVCFSIFIFQDFVSCLDTPISRNSFLWLLPPFISSVYFFSLVNE